MGLRINERIRAREVRVVDEAGEQLGVLAPREALDIARERGLDLIEVAPNANPPVCRIMDYGKYKYEQGKREREAHRKQRQSEMKGMTLRPGTDDHDLDFKIKNIVKFLGEGDKVKVTVRFKSRELAHPEFARRALDRIVEAVQAAGTGTVERQPLIEGRQMIMILAPAREGAAAVAAPKKPEKPKAPAAPAATTTTTTETAALVAATAADEAPAVAAAPVTDSAPPAETQPAEAAPAPVA